jgi:hypothetical protein
MLVSRSHWSRSRASAWPRSRFSAPGPGSPDMPLKGAEMTGVTDLGIVPISPETLIEARNEGESGSMSSTCLRPYTGDHPRSHNLRRLPTIYPRFQISFVHLCEKMAIYRS